MNFLWIIRFAPKVAIASWSYAQTEEDRYNLKLVQSPSSNLFPN